jgi:hypothetical protein
MKEKYNKYKEALEVRGCEFPHEKYSGIKYSEFYTLICELFIVVKYFLFLL